MSSIKTRQFKSKMTALINKVKMKNLSIEIEVQLSMKIAQ